jgi:hypothetical protein
LKLNRIEFPDEVIGKARFSGHLKVSESMSVDGFGGHDILDDVGPGAEESKAPPGNEPLNEGSESSHHFMNLVKQPSSSRPRSRRPGNTFLSRLLPMQFWLGSPTSSNSMTIMPWTALRVASYEA